MACGRTLARFQTGRVYDYAGFMLIALCLAVIFVNIDSSLCAATFVVQESTLYQIFTVSGLWHSLDLTILPVFVQ